MTQLETAAAQPPTPQPLTPSATPPLRASGRRALFWVGAAVLILIAIVATLSIGGTGGGGTALDGASAAPKGSKALVQVLRDHGVHVVVADSLAQAETAIGDGDSATLMLYDPSGYLDDSQLESLTGAASRLVLPTPTFRQLQSLAPSVAVAGKPASASATLAASCALPAARAAARISAPTVTYRITGAGYEGCFPSGGSSYALAYSGGTTIVGSTAVFDNEHIVESGNAALAVGALGSTKTLVWYLPSLADVAGGGPTIGDLAPQWLTPVILLLILVTIAAAVWRGRRFGALVVEDLPVVVRSEETMEGRARLYQRSSARLRALDAIRVGAVQRIASALGLPRTADLTTVAEAAAASSGWRRDEVYAILVNAQPVSDAELMNLSDRLSAFEHAVVRSTDPRPPQQHRENGHHD
jgi:hypothetical protein